MNLIEVKNVYKQYKNGVTALSDITLSIPKGDFVFVIGSTASGKSTLIKLLYRQEKPSRGEVYVGKFRSYPDQLSGGEQQRVSIARAIVNNPKILICDEPTGNLDPTTSMGIMEIINKINEDGTTVIMATHDKDIVNYYKKRVIKLEKGILVGDTVKGGYGK